MTARFVRLFFITTFLLACGAQLGIAQESPLKEFDEAMKAGLRLKAIDSARQAAIDQPMVADILPQLLPVVSDYSIEYPFESIGIKKVANKEYVQQVRKMTEGGSVQYRDAVEAIVELTADRRIVILNEAHDSPQHRAFGLLLARALHEAGFTFLAMETLAREQGRSGICDFEYPTLDTGYYSTDPVFGDFIRYTKNLGYQMVAYEIEPEQRSGESDPYQSIFQRENAQSDNLIKHVLAADDRSRVFVYVGYDHATENWRTLDDGQELGWMAAQIKRKTGIDPLTIDQVGGSYNPKAAAIDPVFDLVSKGGQLDRSFVAQSSDGAFLTSDMYHGKIDLTVFHPVQKMVDGRPDWLHMGGYRVAHIIENREFLASAPTLVQAFLTSESNDGLPVDQVLVESAEGTSTLLLPPGNYRLQSQTRETLIDGETIFEVTTDKKPG